MITSAQIENKTMVISFQESQKKFDSNLNVHKNQ